jgi:uncharacterized LabA/DUF88 family protein
VPTHQKSAKKTAVYIDGYNLYYGRLRGTAFKWLDVVLLFQKLLAKRDQNENLAQVKFFTANALATFSTNGDDSVAAQSSYHRALKTLYGDLLEVVYGTHSYDKNGALLPVFIDGQKYDRTNRIKVWKLEEKKTDVNLAIAMYRDASKGLYDRIILVSNDSDAEPVLQAIREDFPHIMIGVVMPIRPSAPGEKVYRRVSGSLAKHANWSIADIADDQLLESQLPPHVPTKKKTIFKPAHW